MAIFNYSWIHPRNILSQRRIIKSRFRIGQQVWVKPSSARRMSRWTKGFVTDRQSESIVKVNGFSRHVNNIRHIVEPEFDRDEQLLENVNENIIEIDNYTEIEISDGDDQVYEDNSQEEQISRTLPSSSCIS
ncbi:hypothetical protein GJ496_000442 [Pomphorhynchus laevis]|nr:hypothetical protein GJ496_000442 [Pomphorhynchus laevis]